MPRENDAEDVTVPTVPDSAEAVRDERVRLYRQLNDVLAEAHRKVERGKIRDSTRERTRVRQWNAVANLTTTAMGVLDTIEEDRMGELRAEVEELREQVEELRRSRAVTAAGEA